MLSSHTSISWNLSTKLILTCTLGPHFYPVPPTHILQFVYMGWSKVYPCVCGYVDVIHLHNCLLQFDSVDVEMEISPRLLPAWYPLCIHQPIPDNLHFDNHVIWWFLHPLTKLVFATIALLYVVPCQETEEWWIVPVKDVDLCKGWSSCDWGSFSLWPCSSSSSFHSLHIFLANHFSRSVPCPLAGDEISSFYCDMSPPFVKSLLVLPGSGYLVSLCALP